MKTRIDYVQLDNLLNLLQNHNIPSQVVLHLCNIGSLAELTVPQYNYLLLLIKN